MTIELIDVTYKEALSYFDKDIGVYERIDNGRAESLVYERHEIEEQYEYCIEV